MTEEAENGPPYEAVACGVADVPQMVDADTVVAPAATTAATGAADAAAAEAGGGAGEARTRDAADDEPAAKRSKQQAAREIFLRGGPKKELAAGQARARCSEPPPPGALATHAQPAPQVFSSEADLPTLRARLDALQSAWELAHAPGVRAVSFAVWPPGAHLVDVLLRRGKGWQSFGMLAGARNTLSAEEALFLMESDRLVVYRSAADEAPLSLHGGYAAASAAGVKADEYAAFAHLCRLGFVVKRCGERLPEEATPVAPEPALNDGLPSVEELGVVAWQTGDAAGAVASEGAPSPQQPPPRDEAAEAPPGGAPPPAQPADAPREAAAAAAATVPAAGAAEPAAAEPAAAPPAPPPAEVDAPPPPPPRGWWPPPGSPGCAWPPHPHPHPHSHPHHPPPPPPHLPHSHLCAVDAPPSDAEAASSAWAPSLVYDVWQPMARHTPSFSSPPHFPYFFLTLLSLHPF